MTTRCEDCDGDGQVGITRYGAPIICHKCGGTGEGRCGHPECQQHYDDTGYRECAYVMRMGPRHSLRGEP